MPTLAAKLLSSLPVRRSWCALALVGCGLVAGGCATGDIAMLATISGGEKIHVPLGRGGVVLTEEDGVKINIASLTPATEKNEKKLLYAFMFTDSRKRALRSVKVEDVSDETPVVLVNDAAPKLTDAGEWRGSTEAFDLADPRVAWLVTIQNSVRVARFTLTFADGKTLVLLQGTLYPAPIKGAIRQMMGEKY